MGPLGDAAKTLGPAAAEPTGDRDARRCMDLPGPVVLDACACRAHMSKQTVEGACILGAEFQTPSSSGLHVAASCDLEERLRKTGNGRRFPLPEAEVGEQLPGRCVGKGRALAVRKDVQLDHARPPAVMAMESLCQRPV